MPGTLLMTDKQFAMAGVSILDADGQPIAALPDGAQLTFNSDNPDVVSVEVQADGMNVKLGSGRVGTATVTAAYTDGTGASISDSIAVAVQNSQPGSLNFTAGTPQDEPAQ